MLCQLLEGPVFCGIDRWGHLSPTALHPNSVSRVLQRALARAGVVGERYSGHSLRRGFAIWATRSTSTATRRPAKKKAVSREEGIAAFWRFSSHRDSLTDLERLQQINLGFSADLIHAFRWAFDLQDCHLEMLLNASISTLERRRRAHKNFDPVASERLDRIATVSHLAEEIFETQVTATRWMSTPSGNPR